MPQEVFERYAEEYDRWFEEHREEYCSELSRVRHALPPVDARSLEVGAGSGRFAAPLNIALGLEPSRALGRIARRRGIEVVRGIAECMPFEGGTFSSIHLVTALCFLDDPVRAFGEFHRVLVPQGMLVIGFIERGGSIAGRYVGEKEKRRFLSYARFYSQGDVADFLERSGFRLLKMDCRSGFCVTSARKD